MPVSDAQRLLEHYAKAVGHPDVSGFEVLELLDVRSRIALQESELDAAARAELEEADSQFLGHAGRFYESASPLGDLKDHRRRASVPCSHWWWYLEKLVHRETISA